MRYAQLPKAMQRKFDSKIAALNFSIAYPMDCIEYFIEKEKDRIIRFEKEAKIQRDKDAAKRDREYSANVVIDKLFARVPEYYKQSIYNDLKRYVDGVITEKQMAASIHRHFDYLIEKGMIIR